MARAVPRARPPPPRSPTRVSSGWSRPRSPAMPQQVARRRHLGRSSAIAAASASSLPARPRWRAEQVGWSATEPSLRVDLQLREQPVVRPGDRVEDLELAVALAVLLAQRRRDLGRRARARTSWRRSRPAAPPPRSSARAPRPCGSPSARGPRGAPSSSTAPRSSGRRRRRGSRPACPARAETATSASGSAEPSPARRGRARRSG